MALLFSNLLFFFFSHQPPVLVEIDKEQGDEDKNQDKDQVEDREEEEEQGNGQQPFSPTGDQHAR